MVANTADPNILNINARRQDGKVNLPEVLKECAKVFKDANTGGHIKAAGEYIRTKDLEKFKERVFQLL